MVINVDFFKISRCLILQTVVHGRATVVRGRPFQSACISPKYLQYSTVIVSISFQKNVIKNFVYIFRLDMINCHLT